MAKRRRDQRGDDRTSSRWSIYGPACGAILAAVAALSVAVISAQSNAADTQRRIDHEKAQARQDAVGAARVLAGEFATTEVYIEGMLRIEQLIPYDDKYDVEIGQADLKRIASALDVDNWQRVAAALGNLDTLAFYIRDKYRNGRPLDRGDHAVFGIDIASIDGAWEALAPLSGTPTIRANPFGPE